ncbi:hypothetical protein O9Z70_13440 [Devosia sp. YIM 151766]|uniref:phage head-tail joining protein n=1 Tax=Devosia sp. YIM 151766 TaxID=3017325 RepID=UPI00255CBB40|nr:hypothetical protein [Devosia sp. YIM 151766]WIY52452.1 hypothetical protein O9Z70_13440 [Devosia sp. YIM 151766]
MAGFTQAQLVAIKEAYASGITRVSYDGKTTEYRSLAEMKQIIATIEASLAADAGTPLPVAGYASFRRG